jgi:hypothetical protein
MNMCRAAGRLQLALRPRLIDRRSARDLDWLDWKDRTSH